MFGDLHGPCWSARAMDRILTGGVAFARPLHQKSNGPTQTAAASATGLAVLIVVCEILPHLDLLGRGGLHRPTSIVRVPFQDANNLLIVLTVLTQPHSFPHVRLREFIELPEIATSGVKAGPNCCCKPHSNASPNATKCDGVAPNWACWRAEWLMTDWKISRRSNAPTMAASASINFRFCFPRHAPICEAIHRLGFATANAPPLAA